MKIQTHNYKGLKFLARENTSDYKTFEEVIQRNIYEKAYFKILPNERWVDLGGNVGAFALQAISKGAKVDVYEPDPYNCRMIERNLKANGFDANIHQKAVVASNKKKLTMYVGNNNMVWRNSLYKNWGNQKFAVDCVNYGEVLNSTELCCKMDIEGAEMPILESMAANFPRKLVAEWSLDIDRSLNRYRAIIDKLKTKYGTVKYSKQLYNLPDDSLPRNIAAAYDNFYCYQQ